jgi:hypothetical protein
METGNVNETTRLRRVSALLSIRFKKQLTGKSKRWFSSHGMDLYSIERNDV